MHIHYQKIIFARQGGVSDPHALAASGSVGMGKPLASENVKKLHVKGINYLKLPFLCNNNSSLMPLSKFSFQIYI